MDIPNLQKLYIGNNAPVRNFDVLYNLKKLTGLNLINSAHVTYTNYPSVIKDEIYTDWTCFKVKSKVFPKLKTLDLRANGIKDISVIDFSGNTQLTSLDLVKTN